MSAAVQKVVLITAGSAGLGASVARAFAPDHRVVINYAHNAARAESLVTELNAGSTTDQPARSLALQGDMGSKTAVQGLVSETLKAMGRLDIVISNVGWTRVTTFANFEEQTLEEDWDTCFKFNVKTHLWLFEACKEALAASNGAFITTASVAGTKPSGSSVPYAVTKAAQIHLAKCLATVCGPSGIRVNSVSPGLLLTEWGLKFGEEKIKKAAQATKLGRLAEVDDVALQVRALALSQSITGQNIVIDSGLSL